ncbi:MAG: DUF3685 domain-containing protein [Cyanobacteria bacterium P01_A01_bin.37]
MTVRPTNSEKNRAIAVVLVDDDIIFRTGLRVWLDQQDDITIVGEADRERSAVALIEAAAAKDASLDVSSDALVVVVGLHMNDAAKSGYGGLEIGRRLRDRFADVPLFVVGSPIPDAVLNDIQQAGVNGYGLKSDAPDELLNRLRSVATGQSDWAITRMSSPSGLPQSQSQRIQQAIATPLSIVKRNLRTSGVRQIDAALSDLLTQLDHPALDGMNRFVVEGRCRELRAARWMLKTLLSTSNLDREEPFAVDNSRHDQVSRSDRILNPKRRINASSGDKRSAALGLSVGDGGGAIVSAGVEATLFDGAALKLQSSLQNLSDVPLEIDILREDKKRELLYLVVRKLMLRLDTLRQSQVTPRQLIDGRSRILRDLWQSIADDFFGRYYAVQVEGLEVEVVTILGEDAVFAQAEILDNIPYASQFFAHLLFQDPLMVDSVSYAAGTPEAMMRAEIMLDHLIIQVANSIIQPLLNRLGDVEVIKQGFYNRSLMSSRDMAQFRNNLSWRYRLETMIREPVNIFESRYHLFTFQGNGIKQTEIYAPRRSELEALQGFSFLVTLALEFRDAVAPRVRAVVSFVGSGLIYVLTEVIGRGLGLVVRGVIKGIGSAWQDTRWNRDVGQRRL